MSVRLRLFVAGMIAAIAAAGGTLVATSPVVAAGAAPSTRMTPSTAARPATGAPLLATSYSSPRPGDSPLPPTDVLLAPPTRPTPETGSGAADLRPTRIGGDNRYQTAAQIAGSFGPAEAVIIANGEDAKGGFDALAANYLAGQVDAPILLTSAERLPPATRDAAATTLRGATSPQIYVMGQEDSVSAAVVNELVAATGVDAGAVVRIAGANRFATSALAATHPGVTAAPVSLSGSAGDRVPTAILASGTTNADALAAGPLSNAWGMPVLLAGRDRIDPSVLEAIHTLGVRQLLVLGGTDRISDAAVNQALAAGATRSQRVAGSNRYVTAADLYRFAQDRFIGPDGSRYRDGDRVFLANGTTGFPDALAVGPLAGRGQDLLLTVSARGVDPRTLGLLDDNVGAIDEIVALGKTATVDSSVYIAAKSAAGLNVLDRTLGDPIDDINARFLAEAGTVDYWDRVDLAVTYLPDSGAKLGVLTHGMLPGSEYDNVAGLTDMDSCQVWIADGLTDQLILDVMRHEYMHVLQCRALQVGDRYQWADGSNATDTELIDLERNADAATYLIGGSYMYYVHYDLAATPLTALEIRQAQDLLGYWTITYSVG